MTPGTLARLQAVPECPACGYSFSGRAMSGEGVERCPECGFAVDEDMLLVRGRLNSLTGWKIVLTVVNTSIIFGVLAIGMSGWNRYVALGIVVIQNTFLILDWMRPRLWYGVVLLFTSDGMRWMRKWSLKAAHTWSGFEEVEIYARPRRSVFRRWREPLWIMEFRWGMGPFRTKVILDEPVERAKLLQVEVRKKIMARLIASGREAHVSGE